MESKPKACCGNCEHWQTCEYKNFGTFCYRYKGDGITPAQELEAANKRIAELEAKLKSNDPAVLVKPLEWGAQEYYNCSHKDTDWKASTLYFSFEITHIRAISADEDDKVELTVFGRRPVFIGFSPVVLKSFTLGEFENATTKQIKTLQQEAYDYLVNFVRGACGYHIIEASKKVEKGGAK